MKSMLNAYRCVIAALFVCSTPLLHTGCQPALEQSPTAEALPAVQHVSDPSGDAPVSSSATGNWPGWRGAHHGGVADDVRLPLRWSDHEGIRWKVELPGPGNSSPVIWQDAVVLTAEVGQSPTRAAVLCFDRRDGRLRWRADAATLSGPTHVKNGHASASVAIDGQRVYAFFGSAGLFCFDLNQGRQLWHAELGTLEHVWGTASSPVLYDDLVIQLCDHQSDSFLAAFDRQSGALRWRTPRDSYGTWSTPVVVQVPLDGNASHDANGSDPQRNTRSELIVNGTGTDDSGGGWVIAYDPRSGKELWRVQGTTDIVSPTAIVHAGLVVSTSGRNGPIIAIRPGGSGDVTTQRVVWKLRRGGAYVPTGVGYGNRLYTISDGGVAACYNIGNGELIWRKRLKGAFTASLIAGAGRIYATNERGTTYVLAADDTFRLLATNSISQRCLATPAPSRGELFLRSQRQLYCIVGSETTDSARLANETSTSPPQTPTAAPQHAGPSDRVRRDSAVEPAVATKSSSNKGSQPQATPESEGVQPASFVAPVDKPSASASPSAEKTPASDEAENPASNE